MSTIATIEAINASLGIIRMLRLLQVDVATLNAMQAVADREGRELSQDELNILAGNAQAAIDRL